MSKLLYSQMADALLPTPASITSQECDCKWVRRPMRGSSDLIFPGMQSPLTAISSQLEDTHPSI